MMSAEARKEGSFPDLLKLDGIRRNDSELAFQDFLKRIPSSSNLPYLSSGGPSMGNLLDAAMPPPGSAHPGDGAPPAQRENSLKASGLMSGMPRVSSLDFLARLVCSNPMPATNGPSQLQPPGSNGAGGPVKLEPLPSTTNGPLQEDIYRKPQPAPLALPSMPSPVDLQGLNFSAGLSAPGGLHGMPGLPGLPGSLPSFPGLPNGLSGLPGAGGLELGGLPNGLPQLHLPATNPTQAAAAALQLQGQLAQVGGGAAPHPGGSRPHPTPAAPSGQVPQGGAGNSGRHSSKPSSTANTGTASEESDGADNQKGGRGGGPSSKRARRMLSNRESARRSRKRKQEHLSRLEAEIQQLKESRQQLQESNQLLNQQYISVNDHNKRLRDENERLRDELQFLRTEIQSQRRCRPGGEDEKKQAS